MWDEGTGDGVKRRCEGRRNGVRDRVRDEVGTR